MVKDNSSLHVARRVRDRPRVTEDAVASLVLGFSSTFGLVAAYWGREHTGYQPGILLPYLLLFGAIMSLWFGFRTERSKVAIAGIGFSLLAIVLAVVVLCSSWFS